MRIFEVVFVVLTCLIWCVALVPRFRSRNVFIALAVGVLTIGIGHFWFEQWRWQMVPLYMLAIVGLIMLGLDIALNRRPVTWRRLVAGGIVLLLVGIGLVLPIAFPVPQILAATGPHRVGVEVEHWIDESRTEIYGPDDTAPREIMVQIWYPTRRRGSTRVDYINPPDVVAAALGDALGLPAFAFSHLNLVKQDVWLDAELDAREGPYPVLLFSHGWTGTRNQNTFQLAELASHGYIVVSVDHTYGAVVTPFPDGRAIAYNPEALPGLEDFDDEDDYVETLNLLVSQWSDDFSFILDELETRYSDDVIDLDNVGILGHSTGAGAAVQHCNTEDRCKVGLAMDPFLNPVANAIIDGDVEKPFFYMHSEAWMKPFNKDRYERLVDSTSGDFYELYMAGTKHLNWSDFSLMSPFGAELGLDIGTIDAHRSMEIINAYSVAFFDHYLKDGPNELLTDNTPYPEVTYRTENLK